MKPNRLITATLCLAACLGSAKTALQATEPFTAYLMAYFGPEEKLFYAWSRDARNWTALNGGKPVFDAGVRLRDPYVRRVGDRFHLVHTKGWDHPTIFHWESADLVNWKGGPIDVVPPDRKRAWAPEFFYEPKSGLFYVFWASIVEGHNTMHVVTTRDWSDITPDRAQVYYDIGIHDIDLTITEVDGIYYGFHKPGDVHDEMGNRLSISRTLDPKTNTFADGKPGKPVFADQTKPTEGPEVIRLIGERKWYVYGDPFRSPMEAWETEDFVEFKKIKVKTVPGSKHCSMLPITEAELRRLRETYPDERTAEDESAKAPRDTAILLPHAKQQPGEWQYTFEKPTGGWFMRDFDDSRWKSGQGGFGTRGTPNTQIGTVWDTKEIWLRRSFTFAERPEGELYLLLHHDEDTTVYLNGIQAAAVSSYNADFVPLPLSVVAAHSLKPGTNTIAVHCRQTTGGQYIDVGLVAIKEDRWSRKKAWRWFNDQPWPCGFNYIPANSISYTEMWMPYCYDPKFIDRELALAEDIGLNCLRVVLPFVVWEHDPDAFKDRLRSFVSICDKRGIKVMFTLFDDCAFGSDEKLKNPRYGKQPEVLKGWYANGWTPSPGHELVRNRQAWLRLEKYVKDVITLFKDDARVWVWDLYNEPTNGGLGDVSVPLVENVFRWARQVDPSQPLTVAQWNGNTLLNRVIYRNSDIVTFHDYGSADNLERHIRTLQVHGRPLINTEWLNRGRGSVVETCLPLFAKEKVGCMHWGLVNGKTQTHLHWGWRPGMGEPDIWQHDLFHADGKTYRPKEIELFRKYLPAGQRVRR